MSLQEFKDKTATSAFGMTKSEAHAKGICIDCKEPVNILELLELSPIDAKEYQISGICPKCWDKIFDI